MNNKGFIRTVILIVIALIVLGYFGFDVKEIINGSTVQSNLKTAWDFVLMVWNNYLAAPVIFIIDFIWNIIKTAIPASN